MADSVAPLNRIDDEKLVELESLLAAATRGEWFVVGPPWNEGTPYIVSGSPDPHYGAFIADFDQVTAAIEELEPQLDNSQADAALIAALRNAAPLLLAEVKAQREETERLEQRLAAVQEVTEYLDAEASDREPSWHTPPDYETGRVNALRFAARTIRAALRGDPLRELQSISDDFRAAVAAAADQPPKGASNDE